MTERKRVISAAAEAATKSACEGNTMQNCKCVHVYMCMSDGIKSLQTWEMNGNLSPSLLFIVCIEVCVYLCLLYSLAFHFPLLLPPSSIPLYLSVSVCARILGFSFELSDTESAKQYGFAATLWVYVSCLCVLVYMCVYKSMRYENFSHLIILHYVP